MIYLDHHATTPVLPEAVAAMLPFFTEFAGNPSSAHAAGRKARQALEEARERIARCLDAFPDEVVFTSGATESNNLAVYGLAGEPPGQVISSPLEHPCVMEPLKHLASRGFVVDFLPVSPTGLVNSDAPIPADTHLLTLMLVNHETGAVQPVAELARRFPQVAFHVDAAQAVGKIPVSFHQLGFSTLSASGHKFGAPKGIGVLLVRRGVTLRPLFHGGHQQQGRRPGTEPVALAVGMATALELACSRMTEALATVRQLRTQFIAALEAGASPIVVNGPEDGSPYVANISFPGCRADLLLMKLDLAGIACSTGSACSSGSLLPSPVLMAMNVSAERLHSAMRFSFGSRMTIAEIDNASERIIRCVNMLRLTR